MRILVWRTHLLPQSETFVRNEVDALRELGHDVRLVGTTEYPSAMSAPDDHVLFGRGAGETLRRTRFLWTGRSGRLTRSIRRWAPDVIHAHFARDAFEIAAMARRTRVPLVVTAHGWDVTSLASLPGWRGALYRWRLRSLWRRSARIIAISRFIATRLELHGAPSRKVAVLYTGIPIEEGSPPVVQASRRGGIVSVGRVVEKKGTRDLLTAVARLPADLRSTPIHLAGTGPLLDEMRELAADKGLTTSFLGDQTPAEVSRLLDDALVFCVPSHTAPDGDAEGLGHVFLEASLHGVPVAAYRHGGVVEAVIDGVTGLLAEEGDVASLTANLERLLRDAELRQRLGAAGREHVRGSFDLRQQARLLAAELARVSAPGRTDQGAP